MNSKLPAPSPLTFMQPADSELLLYLLPFDRAMSLNPMAAVVYQCCQAGKTHAECAAELEARFSLKTGEGKEVVDAVLEDLTGSHVVEKPATSAPSRRQVLSAALQGMCALPFLVSVAMPSASAAVSNCVDQPDCAANCGANCTTSALGNCADAVCGTLRSPSPGSTSCLGDTAFGVFGGCFATAGGNPVYHPDCATARALALPSLFYVCCTNCT